MSSTTTPLPFQTPVIKNAKVVKLELNPFLQNIISHYTQPLPFENEPHTIETVPLIREHLDTYLFYIRYKVLTITAEYPAFQISFPQQRPNSSHIYRKTINPINLHVPIKQVFHAFLNNVKDHNLAHEIPKFSPNALADLQRYINNFDVEIIERLVDPEDNPHHWLQTDLLRIQNFLYHYFKDLILNDQTIPQIKVISLFLRKYFRFNYQLLWLHDDILTTSSAQNTSVNVASPTRTIPDSTRYITPPRYDPPSIPSAFRSTRSISSNNNFNDNPQTSNQYYDPFNYNFYPPSNTTSNTNINQNYSQGNTASTTQNPFIQVSHTTASQNIYSQNQAASYPPTSYSNIAQASQRKLQNPPLTHIPTDPLYQMHPNPNPNLNSKTLPQNTIQHIPPQLTQQLAPTLQYLPLPQDTFMNMSASIPEPLKPFDGLDHSYTPEEYLQQVEARLTFAIGEEPQNNPIKYKSWRNRRMANIQCSLT